MPILPPVQPFDAPEALNQLFQDFADNPHAASPKLKKLNEDENTSIHEYFNLALPKSIGKSRDFFCGLEFEIEDVKKTPNEIGNLFIVEKDNSLRNNGFEYKIGPIRYPEALSAFTTLHKALAYGPEAFTERTSIHVHVNVSNLKVSEVKQFVLLYAILEPLFLNFVGEKRKNNIFCVPLNYTYLPSLYKDKVRILHSKWHKYTAFNLSPIGPHRDSLGLGTIEFRHLYGTKQYDIFKTWITTIKELYTFIEQTTNFNIISQIENNVKPGLLAIEAIPSLAHQYSQQMINIMCQDTLIDVKLSSGALTK